MATLQDLDRAYVKARAERDAADARDDERYHARERIAYTLRDTVRADIIAERRATDGKDR